MICTNFEIFVWCHKLRFLPSFFSFWNTFLGHYFPCAVHNLVRIIFTFCVPFWFCVFVFVSLDVVVVVNAKAIQYIWHPIVSIFTHSIHFEFSALFIFFLRLLFLVFFSFKFTVQLIVARETHHTNNINMCVYCMLYCVSQYWVSSDFVIHRGHEYWTPAVKLFDDDIIATFCILLISTNDNTDDNGNIKNHFNLFFHLLFIHWTESPEKKVFPKEKIVVARTAT